MEQALFQHHAAVTALMNEFEERCQDHFTWIEEVLQVAAENYQKRDVEVLPKTPSAKKRSRRRKPPVILLSDDENFEYQSKRKKRASKASVSLVVSGEKNEVSASSGIDITTDDDSAVDSGRSTRSTRSRGNSSKSSCSSRSSRARGKKVVYTDEEDNILPLHQASMESITEVDEEKQVDNVRGTPTAKLFPIVESTLMEINNEENLLIKTLPCQDNSTETPKQPSSIIRKKSQTALALKSPLLRLKKALTPISPKVTLNVIKTTDESSSWCENKADSCDTSFTGMSVKDKVRAYDNLVSKLSPATNLSVLNDSKLETPQKYKSALNVTLSSEHLPNKARVVQQIIHSPQPKRLSTAKRKSSVVVVSKRSSLAARKSDRIQVKMTRSSLSKCKSFLLKNCDSLISVQQDPEIAVVPQMPLESTPKPCRNMPEPEESTPRPAVAANRETSQTRKRQLTTDSDSSQSSTPGAAKKRARSGKMALSPRVKQLKETASSHKSSDSEYVTDDSDVPPSPSSGKKKVRTPRGGGQNPAAQKATPQTRSPGLSGSFIKRNTPKALTIKQRQELFKKEMLQKRQLEERRLERMRLQKQQELERQKRQREERHQRVQAKRLAQQKAATEQSITTVKSKERRGSAVIREQREKAEVERQKRLKKQAEVEERRRQEEEKRVQRLREKEEEGKMIQAMMQRKKEYEEQEKQRKLVEEKQRQVEEKRLAEEKRDLEPETKGQRDESERIKATHNTSLSSSQLNRSLADPNKNELQSYNIDDIKSDDETDDEDAPKKEIPPWALGHRMKASMIHQHYKPPNIDDIFPPSVLLVAPDLNQIFPQKVRPRFNKRTSSAIWSPIQKHFSKSVVY